MAKAARMIKMIKLSRIEVFVLSIFFVPVIFISPSHAGSVFIQEDLAEGRVTDVARAKKLISQRSFLLFKSTKYGQFLEGYVRGVVTDYDDRPIEGVVVRAAITSIAGGKKKSEEDFLLDTSLEGEEGAAEKTHELTPNFEAGISDSEGVYRVHFSVPIIKDRVDIRGKILYNPGWDQQHDVLGQSYEPQQKESDFRLFFDQKKRLIAFVEGTRKTIVRPLRNTGASVSPIKLKGSEKPETAESSKEKTQGAEPRGKSASLDKQPAADKKEGEDIFKAFNFGP